MKKGFTLQEALLTLGIIGIISAIVLPNIQRIVPDKNKIKYINAYNTLTNLTSEILNDPAYYQISYDTTTGLPTCSGLDCIDAPIEIETVPDFPSPYPNVGKEDYSYSTKFAYILASKMNLMNSVTCSEIENDTKSSNCDFTTSDGTFWRLNSTYDGNNSKIDVTIDTVPNGNTPANSELDINNSENPEHFKFEISKDGRITATDRLGQEYLKDPTNTLNTKSLKLKIYQEEQKKKQEELEEQEKQEEE